MTEKKDDTLNIPEEDEWNETTAMISGYDHPVRHPIGRCWRCGGEVWPIEDECWDGAMIHYVTFAYECRGCGMWDVANISVKERK